jgi:hypothetical protein
MSRCEECGQDVATPWKCGSCGRPNGHHDDECTPAIRGESAISKLERMAREGRLGWDA